LTRVAKIPTTAGAFFKLMRPKRDVEISAVRLQRNIVDRVNLVKKEERRRRIAEMRNSKKHETARLEAISHPSATLVLQSAGKPLAETVSNTTLQEHWAFRHGLVTHFLDHVCGRCNEIIDNTHHAFKCRDPLQNFHPRNCRRRSYTRSYLC